MVAKRCRFHTQSLRQQATLEESAASQQGLCKHSHAVVAMHGTRQTRGSTCGSFFGCAGAVGGCAYTEHSSAEPDVFCLCACRERECSALHSHPFKSLGAGCHRTLPRERVWQVYRDHRGGQPDTESRQCKVVGHLGLRTPLLFGGVPTTVWICTTLLGCVAYVTRILVCGWRMEREKGV